jgi:hypothetical protein
MVGKASVLVAAALSAVAAASSSKKTCVVKVSRGLWGLNHILRMTLEHVAHKKWRRFACHPGCLLQMPEERKRRLLQWRDVQRLDTVCRFQSY